MKRFMVISFLFIFLGTSTVFSELLKLPALIHHYFEHVESKQDANLSFTDFITEHYTEHIHHADKHHDHEKLPFKTLDFHLSQVIIIVPQTNYSLTHIGIVTTKLKKTFQYQYDYSNAYLDSIWQPPRFS